MNSYQTSFTRGKNPCLLLSAYKEFQGEKKDNKNNKGTIYIKLIKKKKLNYITTEKDHKFNHKSQIVFLYKTS